MLAPIKHVLPTKRIILASRSLRRKQLFELVGLDAESVYAKFKRGKAPRDSDQFVKFLEGISMKKAEEVYKRLKPTENQKELVVVGAHTIVTVGSLVYQKPRNSIEAFRMLRTLSGKRNRVFTGVSLIHSKGKHSFTEMADVQFGSLNRQQIKDYVHSDDVVDTAGGFDVSGSGGALVTRIEGDFYCVVGLPLHRFCCALNNIFVEK